MIGDVTQELERYGEYADRVAPTITFEEITDRRSRGVLTQVESRQAIPNWAVAVAAGLATFALVGGLVLLVSGTGADVVEQPMVTSVPVPTTVTSVPVPTTVTSVPVPTTTAPVGETDLRWVETMLSPSDAGAFDANWYGYDVAVDGDRIVISEPIKYEGIEEAGAVYVYEPDGDSGWSETKLTASDGATGGGQFGMSVAVDGDIVVVGRPFELDPDGGPPPTTGTGLPTTGLQGAVHVFESDGDGGWAETKLTASDAADQDQFGSSVAVSGDRIVVGAGGDDERAGAVYVFERGGQDGWLETKLTASDRAPFEYFGYWASGSLGVPVAVEGDRIAVGSKSAVYLFEPDGNGGWAETRLAVTAYGVAIDGDRLVIGSESGVHVYERDATGEWAATDLDIPERISSLDASDGRIAITVDPDARSAGGPGIAYLVEKNDEGDWAKTVLKSPDTDPMDGGDWSYDNWAVAIDGDRVVVGAPYAFTTGVAYVYEWISD